MQGQHMKEGIHFNDTHAPVPSPTSGSFSHLLLQVVATLLRWMSRRLS